MPANLTVVVPMYNSAATVAATLDSLLAQTFADWSCVVINDGSSDDGPSIVERYAARDGRITMLAQPNRGLPGARNTGLEHALNTGAELVHFLDADDWMAPDAYRWLAPAAMEAGASYGGYELCGPTGRPLGRQSPMSAPYVGLNEQIDWNRAATHAMLFRADVLKAERFNESLSCVEDYDMWLRLALAGLRLKGVDRIVCGYRLRPDSMSKKFAGMSATYQAVLSRHVRAARDAGWGERIDLSEARLAKAMGGVNLGYATMDALADPGPGKARAAALLDSRIHSGRFTPAELAQAASTALLLGSCVAPDLDGWAERAWLASLRRWWVRCAEEGWTGFDEIEPAFAELATKIVHPDPIVAAMLEEAALAGAGELGLVVLGAERFGRRLARSAARRGWRVLVLDDFSEPAEAACLEPHPMLAALPGGAPLDAAVRGAFDGAPMVTGLMSDAQRRAGDDCVGRSHLRPGSRIEWRAHRDALGRANLDRIHAALSSRMAKAG